MAVGTGAKEFGGAALIVEDDALIALELSDMVAEMGFGPVYVARTSCEAMARTAAQTYAIAVIDIKLGVDEAFVVARRLKLNGSPFVFASGYTACLPADLQAAPFVPKPFTEGTLTDAIRVAVSAHSVLP